MDRFLRAVRDGAVTMAEAADAACISRATAADWLRKADLQKEPYAAFLAAYRAALQWRRGRFLAAVETAAENDWRAAAYLADRLDKRLDSLPDPVQQAWQEKTPAEVLDMMCEDPEIKQELLRRLLAQ